MVVVLAELEDVAASHAALAAGEAFNLARRCVGVKEFVVLILLLLLLDFVDESLRLVD